MLMGTSKVVIQRHIVARLYKATEGGCRDPENFQGQLPESTFAPVNVIGQTARACHIGIAHIEPVRVRLSLLNLWS